MAPQGYSFDNVAPLLANASGSLQVVLPTTDWPAVPRTAGTRGQALEFQLTVTDPILSAAD